MSAFGGLIIDEVLGGFGKYSELLSAFAGLIIEFDEVLGRFGKYSELVSAFGGLIIEFDEV